MKRWILFPLTVAVLASCTACGKWQPEQRYAPASPANNSSHEESTPDSRPLEEDVSNGDVPSGPETAKLPVDIDLSTLSSTMVYTQVYHMMSSPSDYIGKVIRMQGLFVSYQNPDTQQISCAVIVQDATACCAQGFDIVMPEHLAYPEDYPPSDTQVTVVGELQADSALAERGFTFLRLKNVIFEA